MTELDRGDVTMDDEWLAGRFEGNRARLRAMAYRMLGSHGDADDAVQEAWLHVTRAGAGGVASLDGWFTTIVARVCLDMLRSRKSRREEPAGDDIGSAAAVDQDQVAGGGPEQEAVLADSVGLALLVVLDRLAPAERVAFVLHDMFAVPFQQIAAITGRSPDAARQLASRARRRVRGAGRAESGDAPTEHNGPAGPELTRQRAVAEAFLAASRAGDLTALLAVLDPDVALRADSRAVPPGYPSELRGAATVANGARLAAGRSRHSAVTLVNGVPGIAYAPRGRLASVLVFTFTEPAAPGTPCRIATIEIIADPARLEGLRLSIPG